MFKSLFKLIGIWSPASFMLTIWRKGTYIGQDHLGNKYYSGKARKGYLHERRWVAYAGEIEASSIPPEWHGWMHHQTNTVPSENTPSFRRSWQKPHTPNTTSTDQAYRPDGHILSGGQRAKATGDYEAWTPE
jgi:NADH:ubiquinone oxidoreductase subunit